MKYSIYIGWDPREADAWWVAQHSMLRHMSAPIPVNKLAMPDLQERGLYTRPTRRVGNRLYDELSARADYDGAISTEHANARFFVSQLAHEGWVLFVDGDILVRHDICEVFRDLDPAKAVYCVQHLHRPTNKTKMDNQRQTIYQRKNWSSFMIFNCEHPANKWLTLTALNTFPGRDLHAFCWLDDSEIGALPHEWNYLVGWTHLDPNIQPKVVHFTEGTPDMPGYENCEYADEWRMELRRVPRYDTEAAE